MTTVSTGRPAPTNSVADRSTAPDSPASHLLAVLVALPADHPSRPAARTRAIEAWLPLAHHLARRYSGRGEPNDDLTQTAALGLIKAIDRFDPTRGIEFASYAIPTIVGEIKRHFRDRTWDVRVPRRLQERRLVIAEANNSLTQLLGRSPTVADVARHLDLTEEEVLEGLEGARAYNAVSLSIPVGDGTRSLELGDTLGGDDNELALAELRVALTSALARLDDRERKVVALRFHGNLTQQEIAWQVGVSQMHVSRLLTRALAKLRVQLTATP
ncbi:SigB/SigF/SigG family RNA polymerase sigma factor [Micromonospora lupini]|uniref:RNA polymerase sigma-F factor n=1 Tax=Micromonospora lupini str. Lupac 08 TaxID=1150864 RepID=I0L7M6_9ACTN|nr:SigB/SigF/SigG family RNA polymerase sigma factor [Micromonospora lupini]CCH19823.1 RNA polymerase sigma-F factor [Micromonospora lupini str. Lupac 08]